MSDPGPLHGPDITGRLTQARTFGVSGASSPDGVQTIELTSEPSVHGPHGSVHVHLDASSDATLTANVSWGSRGNAMCRSPDSIRVWGAFAPDVDLLIRAPGPVRLVVRSGAGDLLAGPTVVSADRNSIDFAW